MITRRTRTATGTVRAPRVEHLESRRLLAAAPPLNLGVPVDSYPHITPVNDIVFFSSSNPQTGTELWRSDGTPAGTRIVKDITPGPAGTQLFEFTASGGAVYFWAPSPGGSGGSDLWRSDGTDAGTTVVRRFQSVSHMGDVDGTLFFSANDGGGAGQELWKTDGTDAGTVFLKDINPGPFGSAINLITGYNGLAIFAADPGGGVGYEPFVSDGTPDGTFMLKDVWPGAPNGYPIYFTEAGGYLYFGAQDPTHGFELWRTDGTSAGTVLVKDLKAGSADSGASPRLTIGDTLYTVTREAMPQDLYRTVGATGATTLVKRVSDMTDGSNAFYFTPLNDGTGRFVFSSPNKATGYELWRSDGTAAGTAMVKEINPGTASGVIGEGLYPMASAGGRAYFVGSEPATGNELWSTDGTAAGTVRVADINPGAGSSKPVDLLTAGDKLFFGADATGTAGFTSGTLWVVAPQVPPTPGGVSGIVFNDVDDDGTRDASETGLAGFRPYVDLNDSGFRDPGEPSTTTDGSGNYTITNVPPGNQFVRTELPTGWEGLIVPTRARAVTVAPGQTATGAQIPAVVHYGDVAFTAFEDLDRDGVRDPGEPPLAGLRLYDDRNRNNTLDAGEVSFVTDASGRYAVNDFVVGTYRFGQVVPSGFQPTVPATGYAVVAVGSGETRAVLIGDARTSTTVGSISGVVFNDFDADGVRDAGEPVLTGRTAYLDSDNDGVLDAGERSVATDAFGGYAFTALPAGSYFVRQVLPAGWRQTAPASGAGTPAAHAVTLTAGQNAAGRDFAAAEAAPPGSVSGTTYFDANANGVRDDGESALSGRTVFIDADLDGILDAGERSATTDAAGGYSFVGVAAGTYTLRQTLTQTYVQTQPVGNERSGRPVGQVVTVPSGGAVNDVNFGSVPGSMVGRIFGFVFDDTDADGVRDTGENALVPGRVVYLDADNDGTLDAGERSFTTEVDGFWFDALAPGTYIVRAVVPAGYTQTAPAAGAPFTVTVAAGQRQGPYYFGLAVAGASIISGTVYNDADANGTRDPGEAAVSNQVVYVDADNDGVFDAGELSARSDASGRYTLPPVPPGTYVVRQVLAGGYAQTEPGRDNNNRPLGHTVTVADGQPAAGVNFGSVRLSSVSGFVFNDANGNGVQDEGEGSPGVPLVVYLDADGDAVPDEGEQQSDPIVTNGYIFHDLLPGTYAVRVVVPAGFAQTFPGGDAAQVVTVGFNQTVTGKVFGLGPAPEPVVVTLPAAADAYVKDGTSADTKYGAAAELQVKKSTAAGLQRETYLRFDLTGTRPVTNATLRLNGALQSASGESIEIGVYPSADVTWPENDVTWNTKPAAAAALATQAVVGTAPQWYEWDVTDYVRQRQAAGAAAVTLVLKGVAGSSAYVKFASDESADAATRPQLLLSVGEGDQQPPAVTSLTLRGSAWPAEFAAAFAAAGLGDGGYALPAASSRTLPWFGADTLVVRFSEAVLVQQDDLRVRGSAGTTYGFREFRYDPASFTATWVLSQAPGADRLTIELEGDAPGGVTDAAGNYLGTPGAPSGDYAVAFNVLQGDATGDGVVNSQDLAFVKQRLNRPAGSAGYSLFADIAPDGRTNATDLAAVKQRLNRRLPAAQQVAAPPGSMGSIPWRDDDEDSLLGTSPTDPPLPA